MPLALLNRFKGLFFNWSPAELEKRYHHLLILLAIAVIAYALVGLGYDFMSFKLLKVQRNRPAAASAAPGGVLRKEPPEAYAAIPQRNLFGSTDKAVAEKKAEAEAAVEGPDFSTLVAVKGIVAGSGKDGFVVVEEQGKNKQMLYKVGNMVAGAKLVKISRKAVTFLVGDKERVLKMVETSEGPLMPARPGQPTVAMPARGGPMVISRSEVDASLRDMGTMLSQAQLRPYYTDGKPDGFIITNIRPGSVYERLGLVNGDVVQGTDGRKLVTADDVTALYNSMKSNSSFMLKIRRGGSDQSLQYVFR